MYGFTLGWTLGLDPQNGRAFFDESSMTMKNSYSLGSNSAKRSFDPIISINRLNSGLREFILLLLILLILVGPNYMHIPYLLYFAKLTCCPYRWYHLARKWSFLIVNLKNHKWVYLIAVVMIIVSYFSSLFYAFYSLFYSCSFSYSFLSSTHPLLFYFLLWLVLRRLDVSWKSSSFLQVISHMFYYFVTPTIRHLLCCLLFHCLVCVSIIWRNRLYAVSYW